MQQEAPDKLNSRQPHHLQLVVIPVVLVAEHYLFVVHINNTLITDGNAVTVAGQVGYYRIGVGHTCLAVHHPLGLHQGRQCIVYVTGPGDTVQVTLSSGRAQGTDHLAPEDPGQGLYREQVAAPGRVPLTLRAQRTAWYQAVQVDMLAEVLTPGVQHRGHPQLTTQVFGVGGEGLERCPDTLE